MEYTTDTAPIVDQFVADQRAYALDQAARFAIDLQMLTFCADLRELAGDDPDPALTESIETAEKQIADVTAAAARYAKRMPKQSAKAKREAQSAVDAARAEWLHAYVERIEADHARHAVLADEAGDDAEAHRVAMLTIEGAHKAALAELSTLEPTE